jgi:hypothetical protein
MPCEKRFSLAKNCFQKMESMVLHLSKRELNARGEEKTRNALKYSVRWEVIKVTQPRKRAFRVNKTYPCSRLQPI